MEPWLDRTCGGKGTASSVLSSCSRSLLAVRLRIWSWSRWFSCCREWSDWSISTTVGSREETALSAGLLDSAESKVSRTVTGVGMALYHEEFSIPRMSPCDLVSQALTIALMLSGYANTVRVLMTDSEYVDVGCFLVKALF